MAKKSPSRQAKRRRGKKAAKSQPAARSASSDTSAQRFVGDLLVRGEAQTPRKGEKLPSEATHAIVPGQCGATEVRRVRFKAF